MDSDFVFGYKWLIEQMEKRIGRCEKADFPIWAWCQYNSENKPKPDLRCSSFLESGTKGIRLEIEKDPSSVLLSDFKLWHFPLAYKNYIGNSEKDSVNFNKLLESRALSDYPFEDLPKNLRLKIMESWEVIFNLDFDDEYFARPRTQKAIQATFWELKLEEIVAVDYFTAR